jgi:hypothetical protein
VYLVDNKSQLWIPVLLPAPRGPPPAWPPLHQLPRSFRFPQTFCAPLGPLFQNPHALYQSCSLCYFLLPFSKNTLFWLPPVGSRTGTSGWTEVCGLPQFEGYASTQACFADRNNTTSRPVKVDDASPEQFRPSRQHLARELARAHLVAYSCPRSFTSHSSPIA